MKYRLEATWLRQPLRGAQEKHWLTDILLPFLFTTLLASCLLNLGAYATQGHLNPPASYATPAFAC
jgi:hypothetical protein